MCSKWLLSVEMKVDHYTQTSKTSPKNANIIFVRAIGSSHGSRIPSVWLNNLGHIWIEHRNNKVGFHFKHFDRPESSFKLTLSELNGRFKIEKDGVKMYEKAQMVPTNFDNVEAQIYLLSPYHAKPSGWYKNFQLWTQC